MHRPTRLYASLAAALAAPLIAIDSRASEMQPISHFEIDRTEVTIAQFRRFVQATGTVTQA